MIWAFVLGMAIFLLKSDFSRAETKKQYMVSLPEIRLRLEPPEQIDQIEVFVKCGTVTAVNTIPYDWAVQVDSPVSGNINMRMEAGHGSTSVRSSKTFDNFLTIMSSLDSCFDISMNVRVFWGNEEKTINLKRPDLKLKILPSQ